MALIFDSLIKGFDVSYDGFFDFSTRSIFFTITFFVFWMTTWELITRSLVAIENRMQKNKKPVLLFAVLASVILLSSTASAILFNAFYRFYDVHLFGMAAVWADAPLPHTDLVYPLIFVTMLISVFDVYTRYASRIEKMKLYTSNLEQDHIRAQYQALKNQVDPHFFFNSLSVLSSIVQTDPKTAGDFIQHLSKLYRTSLENKQVSIVSLNDELDYLDSYLYLMKIRFPFSLDFRIGFDRSKTNHIGIHPNCLQLLIENAIKHNSFRDETPLTIEIYLDDGYICVKNRIMKREQTPLSTGIGLDNIRRRYALNSQKAIEVSTSDGYFIVKLPVLEFAGNEDRNR